MSFVVDASIALAWFLPDEASSSAHLLLDRIVLESACAPAIWPLEITNALLVAEQRKRISGAERASFLDLLAALPVSVDQPAALVDLPAISTIAREHALSAYDACYLHLAQSRRIPLATFDPPLRAAAPRSGVATLP
jgi:predicted nucleic acid-binding protein